MALPTSNLSVNLIYTTLGVSSGRDLFYIGSTLKTVAQLALVVNKNGLNPTYCPGANADARLANLLADRKLSYFKGYETVNRVYVYNNGVGNFTIIVNEYGEHTVQFLSSYIAISRTTHVNINYNAIKIQSTVTHSIPAGAKFYVLYDDLSTTEGFVSYIKTWGSDSDNQEKLNNPADTSISTLFGGTTPVINTYNSKVKFEILSSAALYSIKIREIYYEY